MKYVPSSLTRAIGRQGLVAQKNAPTLLFGAGVLGMIGATVLACRATLKVEEKLHSVQVDLHTANTNLKDVAEDPKDPRYDNNEYRKDIALIYGRATLDFAKLYGPSVLLGAASIAALTKSHNMLQDRLAAVTAAYAVVDTAFQRYRERVVEKYGLDEDQRLRYETEDVDIIEENGKIVSQVRVGPDENSMYARFFDQMSANWNVDPEINLLFLRNQQMWFNDLLTARGHVWLNEVYDSLDLDHTEAGAVVGWVISDGGDNYIDFGIWDGATQAARDFVNGREGAILLDFNVDGIILDKIGKPRRDRKWQS